MSRGDELRALAERVEAEGGPIPLSAWLSAILRALAAEADREGEG